MSGVRLHRARRRAVLGAALLALAAPAVHAATPAAPTPAATPAASASPGLTGYGPVALGTSLARARELLPAARPIENRVMLGAPTLDSPHIQRLVLEQQAFPGLPAPIDVELRFWNERLWIVHLYTRTNPPDAVRAMLRARLGPPTDDRPRTMIWATDATTISAQLTQGWIAITDVAISREPQAWFNQTIGRDRPTHSHDPMPPPATPPTPAGS